MSSDSDSDKTYVGDTGTAIILDVGADISAATELGIEARRPDGTVVTWSAVASGATGVRFDTMADSLDIPGNWTLQAVVALPTGRWRGKPARFRVYAPFR